MVQFYKIPNTLIPMTGHILLEVEREWNITFQIHNRIMDSELVMVDELVYGVVAGGVVIVVAEAVVEPINTAVEVTG